MGRSTRTVAAMAVAAAVLLTARPGRAEPYRDTAHKFVLDVPSGWEAVGPRDLAAINVSARRDDPADPAVYVAAFRPAGTVGIPVRGKAPLALVLAVPTPKHDLSYAEFEKEITAVFTTRDARGRSRLRGPLAFDPPRKRVTVQVQFSGYSGYDAGFLGQDELIIVQCLTEDRTFKEHLPTFEKLADSFRFEDPQAPPPPPPAPWLDRTLGTHLGEKGQMAVVGGAVGLLVLAVGAVALRDKPGRAASRF